jgi:HEAT repeat protein
VTGVLAVTAATMGTMAILLLALIVVIRLILTRRQRWMDELRPSAETSVALYLAGDAPAPEGGTARERAVLLDVSLDALSDVRGSERTRLIALLEQFGYLDQIIRRLGSWRRVTRRRAADMLATIAAGSAAPALAAGSADRDIFVRTTCAAALTGIGGPDVVPGLIATAKHAAEAVPGAAASIILGLGMHQPSALTPLLSADAAPAVRALAVAVASELRLAEHSEGLRRCLDSDALAADAARGLGLMGEIAAVPALMAIATDKGRPPEARTAATVALGRIGSTSALSALEAQLGEQDWSLRAAAAQALHSLGTPGDAALRRAASTTSSPLKELAEAVLQP